MVVLARASRLSRIPETSVWMAAREASDIEPVLEPCTASSRTRCTCAIMFCRAESVASSMLMPSEMFRAYWVAPASSCRVCIAELVPLGSSDGLLIVLPEVKCCCSLLIASRFRFSPCRLVVAMDRCVTRIRSQPHSAGAVDEHVQRLVDRGDHACRRGVRVLELKHVRHLLVEVDAGDRLSGGVHLAADDRLSLKIAGCHRRLHAKADDELAIGHHGTT